MKPLHDELKEIRLEKGITLEAISQKTKIRLDYLQRIEEGDYNILPAPFVRAFIREYAETIGVDPHLTMLRLDNKVSTIVSQDSTGKKPAEKFQEKKKSDVLVDDLNPPNIPPIEEKKTSHGIASSDEHQEAVPQFDIAAVLKERADRSSEENVPKSPAPAQPAESVKQVEETRGRDIHLRGSVQKDEKDGLYEPLFDKKTAIPQDVPQAKPVGRRRRTRKSAAPRPEPLTASSSESVVDIVHRDITPETIPHESASAQTKQGRESTPKETISHEEKQPPKRDFAPRESLNIEEPKSTGDIIFAAITIIILIIGLIILYLNRNNIF